MTKTKKTVDLHSRQRRERRTTITVTHGFVNTVCNRRRQSSAILHKIVLNLAVISSLVIALLYSLCIHTIYDTVAHFN